NRVQELGDRYYPVNKHVKIRYTLSELKSVADFNVLIYRIISVT
ncbi:hypothetical protein PSZ80_24120, partial [Shigella sonnei]|nr:hypothetical protein [Shigella sonnei]